MRPSDYLPADVPPINVAIVEAAHDDIGEGEDIVNGRGSNRSAYVDRVNTRFGSPLGSYWCGNAAGGWWTDGGAEIPPEPGAAENWRAWAKRTGRWRRKPYPGYAALFGTLAHCDHIEVVARLVPDSAATDGHRILDIGGNTSLGTYNRDGWTVAEKILNAEHLVGYVSPDPLDGRE